MNQLPHIPNSQFEPLAHCLGECGTGTQITKMLNALGYQDTSCESTKWKRLYHFFCDQKQRTQSTNHIYNFIKQFMAPVRFVNQQEAYEASRHELNTILSFIGIELSADGEFRTAKVSKTLSDAERRYQTIQQKFRGRRMHSEVVKYCSSELMQENYFHAVFESTKGLAERIRLLSGEDGDGAALIDKVFSLSKPILAINTLQTESERSEHKGFAQLLKGCFAAIRNPLAHDPKILWNGGEDAADYFSLISLLHRKLDDCVKIPN